mgnify:CR=1 FL=1
MIFFVIVFSILGILTGSDGDNAPFFAPAMAFFWLFNIIDAYRQAVLINHGYSSSGADGQLFVVEQPGRIKVVGLDGGGASTCPERNENG